MTGAPPALPPTLRRVLQADTCAGCGLCAGIDPAVAMGRDGHGWFRPEPRGIPAAATDAMLAAACPGARISPWNDDGTATVDPLWGPWHSVLTAHAADPEIRHTGSSGGVLSALAAHLLETGAVDRVLHVAMDPDHPLLTSITRSTGRAAVVRAAGSRYAPAAPLAELRADLAQPGRILFIGKPCDAGALRQLCRSDPAVDARFPYIFSFFCAGTPSQRGTDRLVRAMGLAPDAVRRFRYRGDGWPGFATAITAEGHSGRLSYAESWGGILAREVQMRCKICADGVGGAADLAAADAWHGGADGYPDFDEADGRSLLIARTERGEALVRAAAAAGVIISAPARVDDIIAMQPHQARRKQLAAARMAGMRLAGRRPPAAGGLKLAEAARQIGIGARLKSLAGTVRRIWNARR
jgi:coenzyme F420 hydrogenase subunit beta